jgi:hypothetical protein
MFTLRKILGPDLTSIFMKYSYGIDFHVAAEENEQHNFVLEMHMRFKFSLTELIPNLLQKIYVKMTLLCCPISIN